MLGGNRVDETLLFTSMGVDTLYPIQWKPPAERVLLFRAQLSVIKRYGAL